MIVYLVTLLLVNTCSRSFGNPVIKTEVPPVSTALASLADHCESSVLATLINSKKDECSVALPPYKEKKQFECFLFLDINAQLCNAVAEKHLNVPQGNITVNIMQPVDVEQLCTSAKDWKALTLDDYPLYKATVDKVFKNEMKCATVCGVEDVTSQDSNFYCKYYKWGIELLAHSISVPEQVINNISHVSEQKPNIKFQHVSGLPSETGGANVASSKNTTKSTEVEALPANASEQQTRRVDDQQTQGVVDSQANSDPVKLNGAEVEDSFQQPPLADQPPAAKDPVMPLGTGVSSQGQNTTQGAGVSSNAVNNAQSLDKPSGIDVAKIEPKETVEKGQTGQKGNSKSKVHADEDYHDDEERQQEFGETQVDDDTDPDNLGDLEENISIGKTKSITSKTYKELNSRFLGETDELSHSNIMPDYTDDDEDHFFSFFLTVIIMVVLLYILYHNKNKVSKLFFGLLVEGRQGRRRNSRGHAYRRLDTLEQAMSTNSAAPPSKIIY